MGKPKPGGRGMAPDAPEEIWDAEHEQVYQRVCAIDVGKAAGMVCVRTPARSGPRRVSKVWPVEATFNAVTALGAELVGLGVEKVTVESTSDYWRIWYYLLEDAGLDVQLVNARDVRNVPGRPKTDKLDAMWLARLTERGMLRASFVPPAPWRMLRDYTRARTDLTREQTRCWQRLEKLLEDALIKVSSVASSLNTLSCKEMIRALIAGQRDPRELAGLARARMRAKHAELVEALTGRFDAHHAQLAQMLLDQIETLQANIDHLSALIDAMAEGLTAGAGRYPSPAPAPAVQAPAQAAGRTPATQTVPGTVAEQTMATAMQRLAKIPGIDTYNAQVILAEIGLDMNRFPTAGHLASWAKLTPRTIQSGTKNTTGRTGKGNGYLKGALGTAAAAAARTNTFLGARYRRIVKSRGKLKALVAVARSILTAIWHLLSDPAAEFHDLGPDYHTTKLTTEKKVRSHIRQLTSLGYTVTLTPATDPNEPAAASNPTTPATHPPDHNKEVATA